MSEAVRAAREALALADGGRPALMLAPGSSRGWLGGRGLVGLDVRVELDTTLAAASEALEAAVSGSGPVAAALLSYDGRVDLVTVGDAVVCDRESLAAELLGVPHPAPRQSLIAEAASDLSAEGYRSGVDRVRQRIAAGDVYVLNLTRRVTGRTTAAPAASFCALFERAGADMSALLSLGDGRIVLSVSPERFVRMVHRDGERRVEISPIKGTRPRFADRVADAAVAAELRANEKERAEHVMVVDLERNDLGMICEPGSIEVDPLYDVVPTPYCHQMISTVHGRLRSNAGVADLLAATFPCGSVTGAPKIAAIRIAGELEASSRAAYCGALVVAVPGYLDSAVLIRTLELDGESAAWGTGAGITWHSDPAAEWLETELKASPALGDGTPPVALKETCRVVHDRVPLLDRHLARLAAGGCGPTLLARVRLEVTAALAEPREGAEGRAPSEDRARLSITVTPDGTVAVDVGQQPSSLAVEGGPRIAFVNVEAAPELPAGAAKPADRTVWDAAQIRAAELDADVAVLVDPRGHIVDGATASLFLRDGDRLLTPPSPPALAGVARSVVIERAGSLGLEVCEGELTAADIDAADEVALSNAYGGVVGVCGRDHGLAVGLDALLWDGAAGGVGD